MPDPHTLRTLGLIGGMSWQSTQTYYQLLNQGIADRCGGNASAPLLLYSFNFQEIEALQEAGQWQKAGERMADIAVCLEQAGAEAIMICTNTMHKLAPQISTAVSVPLLHIVDATAKAILNSSAQSCLLLATAYTMQQDFYIKPLREQVHAQNKKILVPDKADQDIIHKIIYQELCQGIVTDAARQHYLAIINRAAEKWGCDSVILGCTEIGLLISQSDTKLTVFDTTYLHGQQGLDFICSSAQLAKKGKNA